MFSKPHCPVIAIEEHYWDEELAKTYVGGEAGRPGEQQKRLYDFGTLRIKEMDDVGIDIQVILAGRAVDARSFRPKPRPRSPVASTIAATHQVANNPQRFAAFAGLPTAVPDAAADELERCVKDLGFKGAMLHGLANGTFLDAKKFWPIFARAEQLDVPIYLHPALPQGGRGRIYYDDYVKRFPDRGAAGLGLDGGDRDHRRSAPCCPACSSVPSEAENHSRSSRRGTAAVLFWRIDQALKRPGQEIAELSRLLLRQLLHHHQQQLLPTRRCCAV